MTADSITAPCDPIALLARQPSTIDPFDRMLLTTDGTVTTLLEACTGEPIVTRTTRQAGPATIGQLCADTGAWWRADADLLELAPEEPALARRVVLCGARSAVAYVFAESLVAPDRVPGATSVDLLGAGASLGRVLAAGRLETRRSIVEIAASRADDVCDHMAVNRRTALIRRTYTIGWGRRSVAAVTEWLVPGRLSAMSRTGWAPPSAGRPPWRDPYETSRARSGQEFIADL
jgi:chorismate-pyruvate lyase